MAEIADWGVSWFTEYEEYGICGRCGVGGIVFEGFNGSQSSGFKMCNCCKWIAIRETAEAINRGV